MHLIVPAIACLVAWRIAVILRTAFVGTTAAENGNSIHDYFTGNKAAKRATIILREINEAQCINLILSMMQHFSLHLDAIVSLMSTSVQFWSLSVFVITPPPQSTQYWRDLAPASMNFQDGFEDIAPAAVWSSSGPCYPPEHRKLRQSQPCKKHRQLQGKGTRGSGYFFETWICATTV